MKIALVIPPYNLIQQGYGSKAKVKYGHQLPLGIGYIAAVLLELGHNVKLIDSPALEYSNSEVIEEIIKWGSDVVGISAMTSSSEAAYSLSTDIKKKINLPIILGGPHSICFPEKSLIDCPSIDISVYGEGEIVIKNLIGKIKDKNAIWNVPGICYRDETGKVVKTPINEVIYNLDNLPSPAWQLYDFNLYKPLPKQYKILPMVSFITSRGCFWGKCTFCYQAGRMSTKYRRYSPEKTIKEIQNLYENFNIKEIIFWDDTFAVNVQWIERFCNLLKEKNIKISWSCSGRVDTVSKKMLQMMKEVGCWSIFYGYETGNQKLLDKIKKGTTIEQAINATKWAKEEVGMEIRGSFMIALPGETPEIGRETVKFAIKLNPTYAQFLPAHPEYGTVLYDEALKEGKITEEIKYRGRTKATYVPNAYKSAEEVEKMVRYAYRKFYLRFAYIWSHIKKIRNLHDIKSYFDGLRFVLGITLK